MDDLFSERSGAAPEEKRFKCRRSYFETVASSRTNRIKIGGMRSSSESWYSMIVESMEGIVNAGSITTLALSRIERCKPWTRPVIVDCYWE